MKTAQVVIGANFGDEGKGLITDFFSGGGDTLVVRHNGGAQAGHTVVTADGRRHVFSHFSSGSFAGADTFLSRFFVCNPLLFIKEHGVLRSKSVTPAVYVDTGAPVTTPYDMMINQIVEEFRGNGRHGSCGMGFGETIERNLVADYAISYADLSRTADLKKTLHKIRQDWLPKRLGVLGVQDIPEKWKDRIFSDGVLDKYLDDVVFFLSETKPAPASALGQVKKRLVFEGAQGLLLDQVRGWFPYVTRSHTGIRNVLELAAEAGVDALHVAYITRAYATRHGAGPLPHEIVHLPGARVRDETNVVNPHQGALRFGWLDTDLLAETIRKDLSDCDGRVRVTHGLAVTCLDQLDDKMTFVKDGGLQTATQGEFLAMLKKRVNAGFMLESRGATRGDVRS